MDSQRDHTFDSERSPEPIIYRYMFVQICMYIHVYMYVHSFACKYVHIHTHTSTVRPLPIHGINPIARRTKTGLACFGTQHPSCRLDCIQCFNKMGISVAQRAMLDVTGCYGSGKRSFGSASAENHHDMVGILFLQSSSARRLQDADVLSDLQSGVWGDVCL